MYLLLLTIPRSFDKRCSYHQSSKDIAVLVLESNFGAVLSDVSLRSNQFDHSLINFQIGVLAHNLLIASSCSLLRSLLFLGVNRNIHHRCETLYQLGVVEELGA